jgi:sRNA-binding carbon storage regulator CsrA
VLTLESVELGLASVTLTQRSDKSQRSSHTLREGEPRQILPDVHVALLRPYLDRPDTWLLGITAPREMSVGRLEVYRRNHGEDPGPEADGMPSPLKPKPSAGGAAAFRTPPSESD